MCKRKGKGKVVAIILIVLMLSVASFAGNTLPQDVVIEWTEVYGVDLDKASEFTTLNFRDGIPKREWASGAYKELKLIKYRHNGGEVIDNQVKGSAAVVVLQATIETIIGKTHQKEVYLLILEEGEWLIDDILVGDEVIRENEVFL